MHKQRQFRHTMLLRKNRGVSKIGTVSPRDQIFRAGIRALQSRGLLRVPTQSRRASQATPQISPKIWPHLPRSPLLNLKHPRFLSQHAHRTSCRFTSSTLAQHPYPRTFASNKVSRWTQVVQNRRMTRHSRTLRKSGRTWKRQLRPTLRLPWCRRHLHLLAVLLPLRSPPVHHLNH